MAAPLCASIIADHFNDESSIVQHSAIEAIAEMGDAGTALISVVADCLQDNDWGVIQDANQAVLKMYEVSASFGDVVLAVAQQATHGDSEVRCAAIRALAEMGEAGVPHVCKVAEQLKG